MGMTEQEKREKVIKGLQEAVDLLATETSFTIVEQWVVRDALAMLKAQDPRLVTESDFDGADEYGYIPVWTEEKDGDMYWECIPKVAITDPDGNEVLRYWTSRPTDEQREATPWN